MSSAATVSLLMVGCKCFAFLLLRAKLSLSWSLSF